MDEYRVELYFLKIHGFKFFSQTIRLGKCMRSDACMKFWGIVKGSVYSTYENGYKFLNYSFNSLQFSEGIPMDEEWPQEIEATFLLFQDKNDGSILSLVEEHKATFKITKRPCNYHDWFYRFNTTTTDGLLPPLTYCKY